MAKRKLDDEFKDLTPLLDTILEKVPPAAPFKEGDAPRAQVFNLGYDNFTGRLGVARIYEGKITDGALLFVKNVDGSVRKGKVTKLAKNYAFVEVTDGIEGLVPLSELSEFRVSKSSDVLTVGQEVKVRVIDLKPDQRRMTLSVRQAEAGISPNVSSSSSSSAAGGFTIGDRLPDSLKHMLSDNE